MCGCIQGHKDIHCDTPCIEGVHNITLPTTKSFPHDGHHSYYYHHHRCHHYHRIVRLLWTHEHSFFTVPIPKWKKFPILIQRCTAFRLCKWKYGIFKIETLHGALNNTRGPTRCIIIVIIKKICTQYVYAIVTPNWCYSRTYIIHIAPIHTLTLILCIMYIILYMYTNTRCRI